MRLKGLKYQQCFNLLASVQYSHSAWFLDSRTSILVVIIAVCYLFDI